MRWLVRFAVGFGVGWAIARARILLGLALALIWLGLTSAQGPHASMNEDLAAGAFFLWLGLRLHAGMVRHRARVWYDRPV